MYNFAGIFLGGLLGLVIVGIYLLIISRFVVEPEIWDENSTKPQNSFNHKNLLSGIIASGIVFLVVLISTLFALSYATRLLLVTFMTSSVLSIIAIMLWLFDRKKTLAKLKAKWYHKPLLASCIITLVFVIVFTIATL